ncbi:helix-turn-helix transcriptional regulator [Saccharopolyspora cebuensis]|uniref:Helix-turn-helix domain-containing protein n=1 Tax=Saccharopolyspora cebuensis TaxID=418759 RepID=A0ABV4CIB4_9PSEU
MTRTTGGTPKARALGAELREARENAGRSLRALAQELETNHVKLMRYETGKSVPAPEVVAAFVTALGVSATERDRLVEMARDADTPNWLTADRAGVHQELTALIEFERTATRITNVATGLIPGLLQTSDYARAVMRGKPVGEVEKLVLMRLGRREVLSTRNAPRLTAIISENALREPIGGPEVMADQLRKVEQIAEWEGVDVRVIRSGSTVWHPGHVGPFVVFEFPKARPIVHLEHYRSSAFLYNPGLAEEYVDAITTLLSLALDPAQSIAFIAERAHEMEAIAK